MMQRARLARRPTNGRFPVLRTAVVIDERYEDHQTGYGHPERVERVTVLRDLVKGPGGAGLIRLEPRPAIPEEIGRSEMEVRLPIVFRLE